MTEHLKLHHLTSFAARYHLASHVRALPKKTEQDDTVLGLIEAAANTLGVNDETMLADNFDRFRQTIEDEHNRHHRNLSPKLAASLKDLIGSLHAHSCDNCFKKKKDWCKPKEETYDNVYKRGACIAPLKALFDELRDWVGGLWSDLPSSSNTLSLPVILFSTTSRAFRERVRDGEPIIKRFHISGFAWSIPDDNGVHTGKPGDFYTKVGLEIRRNAFGWTQYSVLPYLLLHEILCHAFQGLDNPTLRPNAEPSDAWSEGWMDCVAYELALEWLDKQQSQHFKTPSERLNARRRTIELHEARYPEEQSADGTLHPGNGRDAFYAVLASYPKHYGNLSRSRHPVTRLSLRLNAMTIPSEKRMCHLEKFQHLAENAPADLHALIGAINAETDDRAVVALLG